MEMCVFKCVLMIFLWFYLDDFVKPNLFADDLLQKDFGEEREEVEAMLCDA